MTQKGANLRGVLYLAVTFLLEITTRAPDGKVTLPVVMSSLAAVLIILRSYIDTSLADAKQADSARDVAGAPPDTPVVPAVPVPQDAEAAVAPSPVVTTP